MKFPSAGGRHLNPDPASSVCVTNLMRGMGVAARAAAPKIRLAGADTRTAAIAAMARAIRAGAEPILAANRVDMLAGAEAGLSPSMLDRLFLDATRLAGIAAALDDIAALPDPLGPAPLGTELARWSRPNGLDIARVAVPIGVIGIIFEARPNVVADAAALCLRAGNCAILRAGSEAFATATAIHAALRSALRDTGLPEAAIGLVPITDRAAVGEMLTGLDGALDLLIPRGGKSLVERVQKEARIAVLSHLEGICHTYIHRAADREMAVRIALNAKMRRTGLCGATECLLIDQDCADELLPAIAAALLAAGCELRGDAWACEIVPAMIPARPEDWGHEFLAPILAIRVVDDLDSAMDHIARFGSAHTECIVTENQEAAARFLAEVDSAIVLHNASTQFADGGEFGMGAEIGIATGRLHARGPVGARELTTFKYVLRGTGQIRPG